MTVGMNVMSRRYSCPDCPTSSPTAMWISEGSPFFLSATRPTSLRNDSASFLVPFFPTRALPDFPLAFRVFLLAFRFLARMLPSSSTSRRWLALGGAGDDLRNLRILPQSTERRGIDDLVHRIPRRDCGFQVAQSFLPAPGPLVHDGRAEQDLTVDGRKAQGQVDLSLRLLVVAERGPVLGTARAKLRVVGVELHLLVGDGQRSPERGCGVRLSPRRPAIGVCQRAPEAIVSRVHLHRLAVLLA